MVLRYPVPSELEILSQQVENAEHYTEDQRYQLGCQILRYAAAAFDRLPPDQQRRLVWDTPKSLDEPHLLTIEPVWRQFTRVMKMRMWADDHQRLGHDALKLLNRIRTDLMSEDGKAARGGFIPATMKLFIDEFLAPTTVANYTEFRQQLYERYDLR